MLLPLIGLLPSLAGDRPLYGALVAAEGNWLLGPGGDGGRYVVFESIPRDRRADRSDTQMAGYVGREPDHRWRAVYSTHRRGWWPTAALLALLLATPMTLARRAWVLPAGAVLQNAVLLAQVALVAWLAFEAVERGGGWTRAVQVVRSTFTSPLPSYTAAFVLWALLGQPARHIDTSGAQKLIDRLFGRRSSSRRSSRPSSGPEGR